MIADPVTRLILKWSIGTALLCILLLVAYYRGKASEADAHAQTRADHAAVLATLAEKARAAAVRASEASAAVRAYRASADNRLKEVQHEADREADRLRADLDAGRRRLQDRWACAVPGAGQGGAAADAGEADAAGRHDSAVRIVRAADHDAAVISWLFDAWAADRRAVIEGGCATE